MIARLAATALLALAVPAAAQTARPALDYASAATIRDTCVAWAKARNARIAIVVLEPHGMPLTLAHMDGVSMGGGEIAQWKAMSAAKFGRATADTAALNPPANMPSAATITGGMPIYSTDGILLGGVGVSGGKPADDAACAAAGIEAAGLKPTRPAPPAQ
jgi:glc operon protein GlcG